MNVMVAPRHLRPAVIRVVMTFRGPWSNNRPPNQGSGSYRNPGRQSDYQNSRADRQYQPQNQWYNRGYPRSPRGSTYEVQGRGQSGSWNRPPGQGQYATPPNQGPPPPRPNQGQDRPPPPPGNRPRGLVGCYVCGYLGCHSHFHADDERHETFTGRCYVFNQPGCRASRHQRQSGEQGYVNLSLIHI